MAAVIPAFIALACGLHTDPATAASFPCGRATTPVEKIVCGDPELSMLDEHLGRYYSAARAAVQAADSCLVADQKQWLRTQRNVCRDAACLRQVYLQRLAELDPLQPGVTRIRHPGLPAAKALVWIVPPALDQVAAPPDPQAAPLVARGAILNEVADGDGYVLRTGEGKRLLIVPLMFLEPATTAMLESLASGGDDYELRGHAESSADGSVHFAPDRCVFVHRPAR
ncbi:MAG: lysozyme inhibitor LprI family protein [Pseudomonadota bacterium]